MRIQVMKLDWVIQSFLMLSILVMVATGELYNAQAAGLILLAWQFISAIIIVLRMQGRHVAGYFTFLALLIGFFASSHVPVHLDPTVAGVLLLTIPWTLILFYWILTTVSVARRKDHRGRFLPHIGF